MVEYQKDYCKKCNAQGFYFPKNESDMFGEWSLIDNYEKMVAFDSLYRVPHYAVCPQGKYPDKAAAFRAKLEKDHNLKPAALISTTDPSYNPVKPTSMTFTNELPLSPQLEKEIAEIKAMLKINTALLEWVQQALIESNLKKKDGSQEYRD